MYLCVGVTYVFFAGSIGSESIPVVITSFTVFPSSSQPSCTSACKHVFFGRKSAYPYKNLLPYLATGLCIVTTLIPVAVSLLAVIVIMTILSLCLGLRARRKRKTMGKCEACHH